MSRIDEALQRAAVMAGTAATSAAAEPMTSRPDSHVLARYPAEVSDRERPPLTSGDQARRRSTGRAGAECEIAPTAGELRSRLILRSAPRLAVEQYRRLAGALHELQAEHGTKTLMVSSAVPGEGKTLTLANLALTLSESYDRRVLLIDADLRRPSLHRVFGLPNTQGLTEGLRSDAGAVSIVQVTPRLSILPSGRLDSNLMAALTSERMQALLDDSAAVFDWVLLDAPPVGLMPDANLLARLTQGVIFVIAAGSTPFALVERALNDIGRESIVGTVLNRIDEAAIPANGYYQQYYEPAPAAE